MILPYLCLAVHPIWCDPDACESGLQGWAMRSDPPEALDHIYSAPSGQYLTHTFAWLAEQHILAVVIKETEDII